MADSSPHLQWQTAVYAYARYINDYVARGDACGWKNMGDADAPPDLAPLLPELMAQLRAANATGDEAEIARFRAKWPPLHEAITPLLDNNKQGFNALTWLPDGSLLVRTGAWYESGEVLMIRGLEVKPLPDVAMFGGASDGKLLALVCQGRIRIMHGSAQMTDLPLPQGSEGLPPQLAALMDSADAPEVVQQLIPSIDPAL
jgi:hypothetical protein